MDQFTILHGQQFFPADPAVIHGLSLLQADILLVGDPEIFNIITMNRIEESTVEFPIGMTGDAGFFLDRKSVV